MAINLTNEASRGGLLRGLTSRSTDSPVNQAGFKPAIAGLVKEPLSRELPEGTSQIIADKPTLGIEELQSVLSQMPVPSPQAAAQLIAALVSEPTPQPQSSPQGNRYTVQRGDTLGAIASRFGTSVRNISGYRSGNPNLIFPGEQLSIGGGRAPAPRSGGSAPQAARIAAGPGVGIYGSNSRPTGFRGPQPARAGTQSVVGGFGLGTKGKAGAGLGAAEVAELLGAFSKSIVKGINPATWLPGLSETLKSISGPFGNRGGGTRI